MKLPKDLAAQRDEHPLISACGCPECFVEGFDAGATAVLEHPVITKLVEALEHISKTDSCNPQMGGPNQRWLTDWRNITKESAGKALAEYRAWREGK